MHKMVTNFIDMCLLRTITKAKGLKDELRYDLMMKQYD